MELRFGEHLGEFLNTGTTTKHALRDRAIAEYHDLLVADETLSHAVFEKLRSAMRINRLLYGERPIGVALRPHLPDEKQFHTLTQTAQRIASALEKVATAVVQSPVLMSQLGLTDAERSLALVDPGFSTACITTRLDGFVRDDEIKFVEYNAENPSSLSDQEELNRLLFEFPAVATFPRRYRLRQFSPVERLLETLLSTYREWRGTAVPKIAILGFRVDLIYKRIIIHEFLARYDDTHPLIRAYVNHDVCLVNPFRCKIMHKKAVFEMLTDDEHQNWFTQSEKEAFRHSVPWTRRLADRKTTRKGRPIDLLEFIHRNRSLFVLKPNDDYGGHGVYLGSRLDARVGECHRDRAFRRLRRAGSDRFAHRGVSDLQR